MTNKEKYKAILERIKETEKDFLPEAVSVMMIIGYLDKLQQMKLIESAFDVQEKGKSVMAICEEFDWKPSDKEVLDFVREFIPAPDQLAFAFLIKRYRDDREALIEEWKTYEEDENKS